MSTKTKPKNETDLPPELAGAAAELAASAAEQSAALAAAQDSEAARTARAYELLQQDQAAGREVKGWSEYLALASEPADKSDSSDKAK